MVHLAQLAVPTSASPAPIWGRIAEIDAAWSYATIGMDVTDKVPRLLAQYANQSARIKRTVVALADPAHGPVGDLGLPTIPSCGPDREREVWGHLWLGLQTMDNRHILETEFRTAIARQGHGIGSQLWNFAEETARARGRRVIQTWSHHPLPETTGRIVPTTGEGGIPRDSRTDFLMRRGLVLKLTERHATLSRPAEAQRLARLRGRLQDDDRYQIASWLGTTPAGRLAAMARLRERMSADVPVGDLSLEAEIWTPERVLAQERSQAIGGLLLTAAAEDLTSGDLAGYTQLVVQDALPDAAFQLDTLVTAPHRGRGLGLRLKLAALDLLARTAPGVETVHTWNAPENTHMLAINETIGFTPHSVVAQWEKTL
jgi:GNAT superfamily N-acetyltransferase